MRMSVKRIVLTGMLLLPLPGYALDDPTRPAGGSVVVTNEADAGLQLTSIIVSGERRLAIINGKTVRQGERLGNVFVLKIEPAAVIVRQDGERKRLGLLPGGIKKAK